MAPPRRASWSHETCSRAARTGSRAPASQAARRWCSSPRSAARWARRSCGRSTSRCCCSSGARSSAPTPRSARSSTSSSTSSCGCSRSSVQRALLIIHWTVIVAFLLTLVGLGTQLTLLNLERPMGDTEISYGYVTAAVPIGRVADGAHRDPAARRVLAQPEARVRRDGQRAMTFSLSLLFLALMFLGMPVAFAVGVASLTFSSCPTRSPRRSASSGSRPRRSRSRCSRCRCSCWPAT